jgi:hypothetical protein
LGILSLAFLAVVVISGKSSAAQSVNIFGNAVPNNPAVPDTTARTLGVKFWSTQPGTISAITFYRGAASPDGYVARLYSASGAVLGAVTMPQESDPIPGWQTATFAAPISISANTSYIAAYYAPSGEYSDTDYGLLYGVTAGPLASPASATVGGNGVHITGNGFPTNTRGAPNYFVDVRFTPAVQTPPYLILSIDPPNPSILSNPPLGSVVATITPSWSDGSSFTGTLSFGSPYSNDNGAFAISGNNLIINPVYPIKDNPKDPLGSPEFQPAFPVNTVQNVTIVATQ